MKQDQINNIRIGFVYFRIHFALIRILRIPTNSDTKYYHHDP